MSVDNQQDWRHQRHQVGEWKWLDNRGIGQDVKQRDNPASGVVTTMRSSIVSSPPLTTGSDLKAGAAEFVPGGGCAIAEDDSSGGNLGVDGGVQSGDPVENSTFNNEDNHSIQPLEVGTAMEHHGIPEMCHTDYVGDGFDWSMGMSSLAVLPRRYVELLNQQQQL